MRNNGGAGPISGGMVSAADVVVTHADFRHRDLKYAASLGMMVYFRTPTFCCAIFYRNVDFAPGSSVDQTTFRVDDKSGVILPDTNNEFLAGQQLSQRLGRVIPRQKGNLVALSFDTTKVSQCGCISDVLGSGNLSRAEIRSTWLESSYCSGDGHAYHPNTW